MTNVSVVMFVLLNRPLRFANKLQIPEEKEIEILDRFFFFCKLTATQMHTFPGLFVNFVLYNSFNKFSRLLIAIQAAKISDKITGIDFRLRRCVCGGNVYAGAIRP